MLLMATPLFIVGWVEQSEAHAVVRLCSVNSTAGVVGLADSTHPTFNNYVAL
jgi:hypothetical protein